MTTFDPNAIGMPNGNYFALPVSTREADMILLRVPWDVTVSYKAGTSRGPQAILEASTQIDLFDERVPRAWEMKVAVAPYPKKIELLNDKMRKRALKAISLLEEGEDASEFITQVNKASKELNDYVYGVAKKYISAGKFVALVGGDHSCPFGLIKALGEKYDDFGVLHLDAHADLRKAYEGFTYSHASIMYNTIKEVSQVSRLTQVGIRDYCQAERDLIDTVPKIRLFSDISLKEKAFSGRPFSEVAQEIVSTLPQNVYVSFDIDSLSPEYCPSTGTPVPGGLSFSEADYLIWTLVKSGRKIIGFDLCEVAPSPNSEWDANVGARVLFKLLLFANYLTN